MKAKRLLVVPLLMITTLVGCSFNNSSSSDNSISSDSSKEAVQNITLSMSVDYGMLSPNKATHLLGNCTLPFNPSDFNIDTLIAGDLVTIYYTGTWQAFSTYPGKIASPDLVITDVKVVHGNIFEYEVAQNPGGGTSLAPVDSTKYGGTYQTRYCINEDASFAQDVLNYPLHTHIYGVSAPNDEKNDLIAFYSYNPLGENK